MSHFGSFPKQVYILRKLINKEKVEAGFKSQSIRDEINTSGIEVARQPKT